MMRCLLSLASAHLAAALPTVQLESQSNDDSEALMLSPLISSGMLDEALERSRVVEPTTGEAMGEAGFITTDSARSKHMFYWFFPAQNGNESAPVVVWLQGGPGGSSLFGLFSEMGPYSLTEKLEPVKRNVTWNKENAMLFIDNPVGAGFSFTDVPDGFCKDSKGCVAENLYSLLSQFYTLHEHLQASPLYITGESYGGHYVPSIGAYIVRENQRASRSNGLLLPLAGVAIGDGWVDPVRQIDAYPDMMFGQGMISSAQKMTIRRYCDEAIEAIEKGDMVGAFDVWDKMLNGDIWPYANLFHNMTGSNDYDNMMNTNAPASFNYYSQYVNLPAVRKMIHVGDAKFPFVRATPLLELHRTCLDTARVALVGYKNPRACEMNLLADFMVSFEDELTLLLSNMPVLLYSGQLDIIIGAATTERYLQEISWAGSASFESADRSVWRLYDSDPEVAGYVRAGGNLTYAVIRGAGHIAPYDQPERTYDMISRWMAGQPFPNLPNPTSA